MFSLMMGQQGLERVRVKCFSTYYYEPVTFKCICYITLMNRITKHDMENIKYRTFSNQINQISKVQLWILMPVTFNYFNIIK